MMIHFTVLCGPLVKSEGCRGVGHLKVFAMRRSAATNCGTMHRRVMASKPSA
jgi:hypothetical protein